MAREVNVHAFDANLLLRGSADAAMTATETVPATGVAIWGGDYAVEMVVPAVAAQADTLKVEVKLATTVGGTYNTVAATPGAYTAITPGDTIVVPFNVPAGKYFLKITNTITGAAPNFGKPTAGIIPDVDNEYDRKDHFE